MSTYARAPLAFERGEGSYLMTADGRRYLDFASGIAVTALGHNHPHLVAKLTEQVGKLWHTSNLFEIPGQAKLAERLVANSFADVAFFCNSGAEACEGSVKIARKYFAAKGQPEKWRVITFDGAFHGRTLAMLAAGNNKKYLDGFGTKADGFDHAPLNDLAALKAAIGPETCAIMLEPIQGEGGIRAIPTETLRAIRKLCDDHGLLLIMDEVQTGMGRTGKLFAHEWSGITPDIMALAKGLGGGFPMGAILATKDAASGIAPGTHGTTFGGNMLAMAAGNAVLDVMLAPGFFEDLQRRASMFKQQLAMLIDKYPTVLEEVRGQGFLLALKTKVPNGDLVTALQQQQMVSVSAADNTVRLLPSLLISEAELSEATAKLDAACTALASKSTGNAA
ncbi:aspartate aminotransferase family protein [Ferrovibrio sp.]|uniref:aspartate aminotransferase family protein n=1 Tax=Ferrovibrio sp. TaxID=1917215 RepID=UPI0025B9AD8F|nr:aspartate aminotransferase family protein [Ferrovibrio sp.]MBX3452969.1 aspartate aminotransferase family protein [Ferrovibrio sp.]